jgi:hypothetical protein
MPYAGSKADVLRALGRWLDDQCAEGVQISFEGTYLRVTWDNSTSSDTNRVYHEHELDKLRAQARMLQRGALANPFGELAELLRTLGQELDAAGIEPSAIVQDSLGFRVTGVANGTYYSEHYASSELREASEQRRAQRGGAAGPQMDGFLHDMVGLPVVTQDHQTIGKIAAVQGKCFKVHAGLLQRDYWISATAISSLTPGQGLSVQFARRELDKYKLNNPEP